MLCNLFRLWWISSLFALLPYHSIMRLHYAANASHQASHANAKTWDGKKLMSPFPWFNPLKMISDPKSYKIVKRLKFTPTIYVWTDQQCGTQWGVPSRSINSISVSSMSTTSDERSLSQVTMRTNPFLCDLTAHGQRPSPIGTFKSHALILGHIPNSGGSDLASYRMYL